MGLDDLLGDRQAEAGVLAERFLLGAVGVEALEDALELVGADAGTFVVDDDLDLVLAGRAASRDRAAVVGENERALSIRLLTTWPSRPSWPRTM